MIARVFQRLRGLWRPKPAFTQVLREAIEQTPPLRLSVRAMSRVYHDSPAAGKRLPMQREEF